MWRSSFSKGCTPAGSGRAGRSGLKRRRSSVATPGSGKTAVHACISGIRKLARRAGVMRIGKGVMDDPNDGGLLAFRQFLRTMLEDAAKVAELAKRYTVTANDIIYALKRRGRTLYTTHGDWTYNLYKRERMRARIAGIRLTQAQLAAAAQHYAADASQAGSAAAQQEQGVQQEAPAAQQEPVVAEPQQPQQSPAPSSAHSAAAPAEGVPTPLAQRPGEQQAAQPQAGAAAAAAAELAAEGFCADGDAPGSVAPAGERRLSCVPTPAVVSEARAAQIQRWLVEELLELEKITNEPGVRIYDLRRVMASKHGCSSGEVQHVLYCLDQLDRIMMEEGVVYSCC